MEGSQEISPSPSTATNQHGHVSRANEIPVQLATGDLRPTLAALNARTGYRFTGVYRVDPPLLRSICLFDRENPSLNLSGDIHMISDTYCAIVKASAAPFMTVDAPRDDRLNGHSARDRIISYFGIPLRRGKEVCGVLCHFDGRPRFAPDGEREFLESIEPLLVAFLEA